ncbi:MAG TPA: flagellar hook protein FlgE [Acidimicrobiia bacterium]|nr:flagellar hook protein FlgE [Acidimicrobiia bacterium]
MLRSMFAAVTGLRAHQAFMDVVGNNIANVNTTGYKTSSVLFEDLLSQQLSGAGAPTGATGGTNPAQVGLGVRLTGVSINFEQGATQLTGRSTDFAIQGDGFFAIDQGGSKAYTRNGSFSLDGNGNLVTADGGFVEGWQADQNGNVNTNATVGHLKIPVGQIINPVTTTSMKIGGNLPADAAVGTVVDAGINVYDSLGNSVPLRAEFTKIADAPGEVDWQMSVYDSGNNVVSGPANITFDLNGALTSAPPTVTQAQLDTIAGTTGTWDPGGLTFDFGNPTDPDRLSGAGGLNTAAALSQNGSGVGSVIGFSVSEQGLITGTFSNGRSQALGQIALATFANPNGLTKEGSSLYGETVNSGAAQIGVAGQGGRGTLSGGTLEMSNVDLAAEFTNLIVAERGFQANSRVITTADQILQDLVNLKQ